MRFDFLKRPRGGDRPAVREALSAPPAPSPRSEPVRVYSMGPSQEMRYTIELLTAKGLAFEEIDVSADPSLQSWVRQKTGSNEYPQVFLGRQPLGDFGALRKLDVEGNLDRVLSGLSPLEAQGDEPAPEGQTDFEQVRSRLRRGDVLSLTTPDGETFDTWAEIYANPPRIYYRGEPRPIEAMDDIVGEISELMADEHTESSWSSGG